MLYQVIDQPIGYLLGRRIYSNFIEKGILALGAYIVVLLEEEGLFLFYLVLYQPIAYLYAEGGGVYGREWRKQ